MKIIVTAPEIYNVRLSKILISKGFNIISLPSIETNIIINPEFEFLFKNISEYDYVILPSRNAIKSFFQNAEFLNIKFDIFQNINFITIGNDEKYIETFGYKNSIKTTEASTIGIYKALKNINIKIKKIAILVPKVQIISEPDIIPNFISQLSKISEIKKIDAYTTKPNSKIKEKLTNITEKDNYDAILFTSGAEIKAFVHLFDSNSYLKNSKIICFGPYTASEAIKNGLKPDYIGKNFSSFQKFAEELMQELNQVI